MFLYSWKKISRAAKGNPTDCVLIFRMLAEKKIPRNRKDRIYKFYDKDFTGNSFLLHPKVLISNSYIYTNREISVYLALASFRNLGDYLASGNLRLDTINLPSKVRPETINENRLLEVEDNEIIFLCEELPEEMSKYGSSI